jgi:hypothetical protein
VKTQIKRHVVRFAEVIPSQRQLEKEMREIARDISRCQNLMEVLQMLLMYKDLQEQRHSIIKLETPTYECEGTPVFIL